MGSAMRVASSELPSALAALRSRRRRRRVKGPVRRSHGRRYERLPERNVVWPVFARRVLSIRDLATVGSRIPLGVNY
jgi:hypothetical protein